jgi:predicted ferric reductase
MESAVGSSLVRGIWAAMAIAVIVVVLRVFAKVKIHQFRADDVLMIIAMVCFLPVIRRLS